MRFAEFFAGIGGFRLGLERAGHACVWACEIAPFPREVYRERFGAEPDAADLLAVDPASVPASDLWAGGFPCQDVSAAGKRAGLAAGTRSGLVWSWLDLLDRVPADRAPSWLHMENVPGILSSREGEDFGALLAALDERGFVGAWRVLDAQGFGVPQRRRRVFILARRAGGLGPGPAEVLLEPEGVRGSAPAGESSGTQAPRRARGGIGVSVAGTLQSHHPRNAPDDALCVVGGVYQCRGGNVGPLGALRRGNGNVIANTVQASAGHSSPRGDGSDNLVAFDLAQVTHAENRSRCEPGGPAPTGAALRRPHVAFVVEPESGQGADLRARPCDTAPTVAATDGARQTDRGVRLAGPRGVRRLTPRECERLQGFPDDWTATPGASDAQRYRALGNAVAVPVIEWIGRRLPV